MYVWNKVEFDYRAVDENEAYDDLKQMEQDAQDRYFDEEESEPEDTSKPSVYTGELDY